MQRQVLLPTPRPVRLKPAVLRRAFGIFSCVLLTTTALALSGNEPLALGIVGITALLTFSSVRSLARQLRLLRLGTVIDAEVVPRDALSHAIYVPEVQYRFTTPSGRTVQGVFSLADTDYETARESGTLTLVYDPHDPRNCLPLAHCTAIEG